MLIVAPIIGIIIGIIGGLCNSSKPRVSSNNFHKDSVESPWLYFGDDSDMSRRSNQRKDYDPHDNHWESSFDWKDEDNDGYDDRDDGFWNEREF